MILDRLFYEYRRVGYVEKDGTRYSKYQKVPRFRSRHRRTALVLAAAVALASSAALWLSRRLSSTAPQIAEQVLPAAAGPDGE